MRIGSVPLRHGSALLTKKAAPTIAANAQEVAQRGADGRRLARALTATMATGYRKGTLSGAFGVLEWSAVRRQRDRSRGPVLTDGNHVGMLAA